MRSRTAGVHIFFPILVFLDGFGSLQAQTPDSLIRELKTINTMVAAAPCMAGDCDLISNRALNIFLSNKVGSYLSAVDNLTLYKNSVVLDASRGTVGLYHNLYQPKGPDDRVRSFWSIGARANVADAFAAAYTGRQYNNQFGVLVKQTWISKGHTSIILPHTVSSPATGQKLTMDALRAAILRSIITEIRTRSADFERSLKEMDSASDTPGQSLDTAKNIVRRKFNEDLRQEYEYKFALLQSEALAGTFNYKVVAVNWTSISFYIPVKNENFQTAPNLTDPLRGQKAYPLQADITHTWLWEDSRSGRLFFSVSGDATLNNSRDGYGMVRTNYAGYKDMGGADTLHAAAFPSNDLYIGDYKKFITPSFKGQFIYFPANSHIGFSFLLEQNIGSYKALNGILGFPIVLIDKKSEPSVNFEFQLRFFDFGNTTKPANGLPGKTSVGLTVGIPFSKIAY